MASGHNETWQNDPSGFEMNVGLNDPGRVVKDKMVIPYELSLLENIAGRHILDLGSGNGEYTQAFIDKGATVVGLDISRKQAVTASNNCLDGSFVVGDLSGGLPFDGSSFDAAVSNFALMYADKLDALAGELTRVLKHNGKFIFTVVHPLYPYTQRSNGGFSRFSGMGTYGDETVGTTRFGDTRYPFYFRPVEKYIEPFLNKGLQLTGLREIVPNQNLIDQGLVPDRMSGKPLFLTLSFLKPRK